MQLPALMIGTTLLMAGAGAHADTIYTYTGQELTTTFAGLEKTAPGITGTITLANALAPNTTYNSVTALNFSFDTSVDGIFSLANIAERRGTYSLNDITTDKSGNIARYNILLATQKDYVILENEGPDSPDFDSVHIYPQPFFWTSDGPGSFSSTPSSTTPEPSTLALFGTGLLMMTGFLHKRRTA